MERCFLLQDTFMSSMLSLNQALLCVICLCCFFKALSRVQYRFLMKKIIVRAQLQHRFRHSNMRVLCLQSSQCEKDNTNPSAWRCPPSKLHPVDFETTDLHRGHNQATSAGYSHLYQQGQEANRQTAGTNNLSLSLNHSTSIHAFLTHTFTYTHKLYLPLISTSFFFPALYRASILLPGSQSFSSLSFQSPYPCLLPGCTLNGCLWSMLPLRALLTIILMMSCVSSTVRPIPWNFFTSSFCHFSCASVYSSLPFLPHPPSAPDLPKPHVLHLHPTSTP